MLFQTIAACNEGKKMKMKAIKTKRLIITPLTSEELHTAVHDETDAHMKQVFSKMLAGGKASPQQWLWHTNWRIALREDSKIIGSLGFRGAPQNGEVELGYGIHPEYEGNGYASEAVKAAVDWAFGQPEVYFIVAETEPENKASQRVLEKLGFAPVAQGEEGPRFEKERPSTSWISTCMCIGAGFGMAYGVAMDQLALGMCFGVAIGVGLGSAMDAADAKKRADYNTLRGK